MLTYEFHYRHLTTLSASQLYTLARAVGHKQAIANAAAAAQAEKQGQASSAWKQMACLCLSSH